jgi:hypothetical protein
MTQQEYEDMVIARAADLYRQWEARPWHQKLRGRVRAAWRRYIVARKGW